MSYAYTPSPAQPETYPGARPGWITRALDWMDERGPLSWIVVMIGSFIFAGPFGLIVLGFILITGRFRCRTRRMPGNWRNCGPRMGLHMMRPTGNSAFDAYRNDTIARLEREQQEFEAFLIRLREARDKAEFDQYMEDRARAAVNEATRPDAPAQDATPKAPRHEG